MLIRTPTDILPSEITPPAVHADRRQFIERWRVKAREGAFRSALVANLTHHPEWDPILFPEKYLPKKPASAASGANTLTARPTTP